MYGVDYYSPTHIRLQDGIFKDSGKIAANWGKNALVIVGKGSQKRSGALSQLLTALEENRVKCNIYEGVSPNPKSNQVEEATVVAKREKVDLIIGLGGGSVMDCAKAVAVASSHPGDYKNYFLKYKPGSVGITEATLPVITIPTTPGTGSEISPASLINLNGQKELMVSPKMFPKEAIIDPSLQTGIPRDIIAANGYDAFIQGLEGYLSKASQPLSDVFATAAMKLAWQNLPVLIDGGGTIENRANMSLAGICSSKAIGQAGVGGIHALSDPLSGRLDIQHGEALSIVTEPVLRANFTAIREKLSLIPKSVGATDSKRGDPEAGLRLILDFRDKLNLRTRLSDKRLPIKDIQLFASEAFNPDMSTNPLKFTVAQVIEMYQSIS